LDDGLHFLNGIGRILSVNHGVAIGAYGTEVIDRINGIFSIAVRNHLEMMYMNEIPSQFTKGSLKIEITNRTAETMDFNALSPSMWIPLISRLKHRCIQLANATPPFLVML
jgi:hypothetical protein